MQFSPQALNEWFFRCWRKWALIGGGIMTVATVAWSTADDALEWMDERYVNTAEFQELSGDVRSLLIMNLEDRIVRLSNRIQLYESFSSIDEEQRRTLNELRQKRDHYQQWLNRERNKQDNGSD